MVIKTLRKKGCVCSTKVFRGNVFFTIKSMAQVPGTMLSNQEKGKRRKGKGKGKGAGERGRE